MGRRFDLIVFDWDGTLMDSESKIVTCIQAAARDAGVPVPDRNAARHVIGLGLAEAMHRLFPGSLPAEHERIVDHYRRHFVDNDRTRTPLFDGVEDGLRTLVAHGYQLAVATGKSRRGLERVLDDTGTRELFTVSRCADESGSKPHPRMLQEILAVTGSRPDRAMVVGDTIYDIQMARSAGVVALAVDYGVHDRESLIQQGAASCVSTFPEVCAWIES